MPVCCLAARRATYGPYRPTLDGPFRRTKNGPSQMRISDLKSLIGTFVRCHGPLAYFKSESGRLGAAVWAQDVWALAYERAETLA